MTAPLTPVSLSALDLTFVGQYAEVEVIGCVVVRGGISDICLVRAGAASWTRLYIGGKQLELVDDLTTVHVAAPLDPCDQTPLPEGVTDAPLAALPEAQDLRPVAGAATSGDVQRAADTRRSAAAAVARTTSIPAPAGPPRPRRRVLRPARVHAMSGPLLSTLVALAGITLGVYVAMVTPPMSGGTLLGLAIIAVFGIVILRLIHVAGLRHGVTR